MRQRVVNVQSRGGAVPRRSRDANESFHDGQKRVALRLVEQVPDTKDSGILFRLLRIERSLLAARARASFNIVHRNIELGSKGS